MIFPDSTSSKSKIERKASHIKIWILPMRSAAAAGRDV